MPAFSFRTLLGAAACAAIAAPTFAGGLHVPYGDLSRPAGARDFDQRLNAAAHRLCGALYRPMELDQNAACVAAARAEGLSQLDSSQREAFARALGPAARLASNARQSGSLRSSPRPARAGRGRPAATRTDG